MVKKYNEVVGIFTNEEDLDQAVDELFIHGFDQASLSILSDEATVKQKLKKHYKKISELADDPKVPRTFFKAEENISLGEGAIISLSMYIGILPVVGVIILSGGDIKQALFMAAIIGGAITAIGVLLAIMLNRHHKKYIRTQLQKGGLLLWVQLKNKSQVDIVKKVLKKHYATNVHLNMYNNP